MTKRKKSVQKFKDTGIELKVAAALDALKVTYITQYYIEGLLAVDFYLPEQNLVIEADGCYFHSCPIHAPRSFKWKPGKDYVRTQIMMSRGFRVLRLWEHDIDAWTPKQLKSRIKKVL